MCGIPSAAKWTGCLSGSVSRRCAGCSTRNLPGGRQLIQTFLRWRSKAYSISPELPGIDAKDIDVSVSNDTLLLKGKNARRRVRKTELLLL